MDNDKLWQKMLEIIRDEVSTVNFRGWFSQAKLHSISDTELTLVVPSAFIKGQMLARHESVLLKTIEEITGKPLNLQFIIDGSLFSKKPSQPEDSIFEEGLLLETPPPQLINQSFGQLNPRYTLDNFVVGGTNNLAYAAAQAIVQNPGTSYNPLFVYGPSGVGKTHLMQAIGNGIVRKNPHAKIVYASSEKFTNDFVDSLRTKRTGDFRNRYRFCDVLLIDDVQFISGKDSTQEEFFHTFNELHGKNAQIVLTSDRPPIEMKGLESRLMSRFQGGLMVDIQLPDYETRMAILKAKLMDRGESLPEEILTYIAENVVTNSRELEGRLIQILQMAKLNSQTPLIELVTKTLGHNPQPQINKQLDFHRVIQGVQSYFNVNQTDLTGPRRQKELVLPRQIAMFVMYEECKMPMERIGQVLGNRDHTTIMHGVEKIREAITRDREVQRVVIEFKQHLTAI